MQPPFLEKINPEIRRNIAIVLVILLTSSAAFGLGRLSVLLKEKEPITIENSEIGLVTSSREVVTEVQPSPPPTASAASEPKPVPVLKEPAQAPPTSSKSASFIASRTGKSYYFPWCGIVKRIKKENQITFNSREEAEEAGYKPGNCAGMK